MKYPKSIKPTSERHYQKSKQFLENQIQQEMAETIYFNSLRGKQGNYGLKVTGKVEDIIAELQKHANSKGYINLEIKQRKEADKFGYTHYAVVDTWEPNKGNAAAPAKKNGYPDADDDSDNDSLPF